MTKSESVDKNCAVLNTANAGRNRRKFFFTYKQTSDISSHSLWQNWNTWGKRSEAGSFIFVTGSDSSFSYRVGSLAALYIDMDQDPAENNLFSRVG